MTGAGPQTAVPSRQKPERIPLDFGVVSLLKPAGVVTSRSRRAHGYDAIVGLVSGTAAFTVEILGAPGVPNRSGGLEQPGTYVLLETIASAADAESGRQVALIDRQVRSPFVRARVTAGAAKVEQIQNTIELIPIYAWRRVDLVADEVVISVATIGTPLTASKQQDLAAGALSLLTAIAAKWEPRWISIAFDAALPGVQTVSIFIRSALGAAFDILLERVILPPKADATSQGYFFQFEPETLLGVGDEIELQLTNTGTPAVIASATIRGEGV